MKQVIIIFGPPGAGKGTQSELLSDSRALYLFETSKILEEKFKFADKNLEKRYIKIENKKFDILKEKKLWSEGILCSPPFVVYLVKKKIKELFEAGKNLVIAGSPRTLYESEKISPFLKNLYGRDNIKAIYINISPQESVFRNSHRKICELMRHPILYNEETKNLTICPLDGSKLLKRKGLDEPKTIKVRLDEYKKRTLPVLEHLKKEGIKVVEINGEQSVADVFKDILEKLKT